MKQAEENHIAWIKKALRYNIHVDGLRCLAACSVDEIEEEDGGSGEHEDFVEEEEEPSSHEQPNKRGKHSHSDEDD